MLFDTYVLKKVNRIKSRNNLKGTDYLSQDIINSQMLQQVQVILGYQPLHGVPVHPLLPERQWVQLLPNRKIQT